MIEDLSDVYEPNVGRRQKSIISTHGMFNPAPNATVILLVASLDVQLYAHLRTGLLTR